MNEKSITIAVIAPREPFEFFDLVWEGVWSAAYELAPLGVEVRTVSTRHYDISPDGKRFLIVQSIANSSSTSLMVVLNWLAGVKK